MLSAFRDKVRSSNQTLRGIVKGMLQKKNFLKRKKKYIKDEPKDFNKRMLIICLLLNFVFEKKIDFNAWNVFWSGSTKKITLF